jgi:hypothetical protein
MRCRGPDVVHGPFPWRCHDHVPAIEVVGLALAAAAGPITAEDPGIAKENVRYDAPEFPQCPESSRSRQTRRLAACVDGYT